MSEVLYNVALAGSASRDLASKLLDVVSVKDFGAVGDGTTDDTAAFQAAITYARSTVGGRLVNGALFIPNGTYLISSTLELTAGQFTGASLIGESRDGATLLSALTGTTPLIQCTGGSGSPSNVHICDLTLSPATSFAGTGLCLNSIGSVVVERLKIAEFNYGIWLYNDTDGGFTEVNFFRDLWVDNCMNSIRFEVGDGSNSFHGTSFANVSGNAWIVDGVPQIWLNLVSGYWYNFTMGFHIWTHGSAIAINVAEGANAPTGFGSIQIETQAVDGDPGPGQFTGSGTLYWRGTLEVNGTINDLTAGLSNGNPNICCDDYYKSGPFTSPNMPLGTGTATYPKPASISGIPQENGQCPTLFRISGSNIESIGVSAYNGWSGNGLWVVGVGYDGSLADAAPGFFLSCDGSTLESFAASCAFVVNGQPVGNQLLLQSNGLHRGNMGQYASGTVPAGTTIPITVPIGYDDRDVVQHLFFRIIGAFYDFRYVFVINQAGDGGDGFLSLLATLRTFGSPAPSGFSVDPYGNFVFSVEADQDLDYVARAVGIGAY